MQSLTATALPSGWQIPLFRALSRADRSSPFRDLARKTERLASAVEQRWEELPQRQRELLENLAYPKVESWAKRTMNALLGLLFAPVLALAFRHQHAAMEEWAIAAWHLIEATMEAVERSHPAYRAHLAEAIDEAIAAPDAHLEMDSKGFRKWLAGVSNQA